MNSQILKLARKSGATVNQGFDGTKNFVYGITMSPEELDKFSQLIVQDVLKQVETRAYYSGDRAWSDELDRPWIELEYGFGELADAQGQAGKRK